MTEGNNNKRTSTVALIALLITSGLQVAGYYQTQRQLVSPLIQKSIIDQLSKPFLTLAAISLGIFLIALLLHYRHSYKTSIVLCIAMISASYVYIQFG